MSIPPDSPWRGCASSFPQPVNDELEAQFFVETIYYFNCGDGSAPSGRLADIEYRNSSRENDILDHVFRWDLTPYQQVFENGFQVRRQEGTPDNVYYNLDHHVHHGGRPLDSDRPTTHVFVSTTLSTGWHPTVNPGTVSEVCRYEIYAPGGISVTETLNLYGHENQEEVAFVAGIAPQYIRSAQLFKLTGGIRGTSRQRVDNRIIVNGNFNPQQHPPRLLTIRNPVHYYYEVTEEGRRRVPLIICIYNRPQLLGLSQFEREKRQVVTDSDATTDWYAKDVANIETYINAAFRSSRTNEVYLFMRNEYVLLNYAPGTKNDKVVNGPLPVWDGYPSLTDTPFAEYGIDCAFGCHDGDQAFIFCENLCALIDYAPGTTNDRILKGPTTIAKMFPFFKGTVFESGVDAAFEATAEYEAYLFKDNQYALINYSPGGSHLIGTIRLISEGFHSLRGTLFESGIDAAFASHGHNEAYIFKGDSFALINFAPGTTDDYIIGGVKQILSNWPSLNGILPHKNRGLDVHDPTATADPGHGHEEH